MRSLSLACKDAESSAEVIPREYETDTYIFTL